ncbi:MAG: hypothetical protein M1153_02680 [Patescibacteria group bacterium]|nr:hypothetical protein [Patescibacteria group bacterium]
MAESDLQHKEALRRRLEPECREFQRNNLGGIYEVDDLPAVYRVASQSVGMPREDANGSFALIDGLNHLAEHLPARTFRAFAFNKGLDDFYMLSLGIRHKLGKLRLDAHYLPLLVFGGFAGIKKVGGHIHSIAR